MSPVVGEVAEQPPSKKRYAVEVSKVKVIFVFFFRQCNAVMVFDFSLFVASLSHVIVLQ